jgi:hypothetical protein
VSLTVKGLAAAMTEALRDDASILAYCQDLYGKAHAVFQGAMGVKAPQEGDFPVFTVIGHAKERGEDELNRIFTFTVDLELEDQVSTEATAANGVKTVVYRGAQTLEELLDLAMEAIRGISTEIFFDDKGFDFEPIEYFPVFVGTLTLTVTVPVLIGGFEPTI